LTNIKNPRILIDREILVYAVKKEEDMKEWFKKVPFVMYSLGALFLATLITWCLVSDWGRVKVRRIQLAANDGTIASALIYIPPNATDKTPAPVILNFAGRSTNAQYLTTWSLEEARRGFVVISCDVWGNGQTNIYGTANESGAIVNNNEQAFRYIDWAKTCPFIDSRQINIVGYSLGAMNATALGEYAGIENVSLLSLVYCPGNNIAVKAKDLKTNWQIIRASGDEGNTENDEYENNLGKNFGLSGRAERNHLYGSYADKTAKEYVYVMSSIHQTATLHRATARAMLKAIMESNKNIITSVPAGSLRYPWQQFFVALAGIFYVVTVIAFGWFLIQKVPFFNTIINPVPPAPQISRGSYTFSFLWAILLPAILFIPIGDLVMFYKPFMNNRVWRSNYLNGCFFPALVFSLLTIVLVLVLRARKIKAGQKAGLAEYGLAIQGQPALPWALIGKSVILAFIVSLSALAWMFFVEGNMGINYQFWQAIIYNRTSQERFFMAFSYMPIYFTVNIMLAIAINTSRRFRDTSSPDRDLVRDIAVAFLVSFIPVCALLCIQYLPSLITQSYWTTWIRRTYSFAPRSSVAALDYAWNVPVVSGVMAAMNTFFYRKTGTIWPGMILSTIFTSIVVTSNFTLAV
jgi:hypothetical protein